MITTTYQTDGHFRTTNLSRTDIAEVIIPCTDTHTVSGNDTSYCVQSSNTVNASFKVLTAVLLTLKVFWDVLLVTDVSNDHSAFIFLISQSSWTPGHWRWLLLLSQTHPSQIHVKPQIKSADMYIWTCCTNKLHMIKCI
jgi:hypothetical protein